MAKKRILVIGGGVSGLAAIKACKEASFDVVCYERTGEFGGLWRYRESETEAMGSMMKSTVSNTSKEMSAFSDFPPAEHFPTFMHHTLVIKYLEMYVEQFELASPIQYYREVVEVYPAEDYGMLGRWLVKVRNLRKDEVEEETFDGVMVCVGHHAFPFTPSYPNMDLFGGTIMHSHAYKTFTGFENKTVLVIGIGNSGADIAVELSGVAKKVYLSTRRGAWIYPRSFDKGKPLDVVLHRRSRIILPARILENDLEKTLNKRMDHERFGIKPYHTISSQHPTVNDDLGVKLMTGGITLKKDVKNFTETTVLFDGEENETAIDDVIMSTGYHLKFPFLNEDIVKVGKNNKVFLYKGVFPPQLKHHTLAIIGLVQPKASLFPVMEIQSRWFVALMQEKCHLPPPDKRMAEARTTESFRARHYVQSARHSMEISWPHYLDEIAGMFGAKPNLPAMFFKDPKLFGACFFGPLLPYQYRLNGPHRWKGARDAILGYKSRLYDHMRVSREKD